MAELEKSAVSAADSSSTAEKPDKKAEKAAKKAAKKADAGKAKKEKGKNKKNIFAWIGGWFKDLKKEFKKVVWPDRKKVINNTLVVLAVVVIGSVIIGLIDSGLLQLMEFLIGLSS